MNDPSPLPPTEPDYSSSTPPTRPRPRKKLLFGLGTALSLLLLCCVLATVQGVRLIGIIAQEQAAITPVLDQFMQAIAHNDHDGTHHLFSSRARRQMPLASFTAQFNGPNGTNPFSNYQSLVIESISLMQLANTDQNMPQGTVAKVNGTITYNDEATSRFEAIMEKEEGVWRLFHFWSAYPSKALQTSR